MGYCLPCFCSSKYRKSLDKTHVTSPGYQRHGTCETQQPIKATWQEVEKKIEPTKANRQEVEKKIELIIDSGNKHEEQLDGHIIRKKVTFDLNAKTHEEFQIQEIKNGSVELENGKEKGSKTQAVVVHESQTQSDSSMSSVFTYPPSHRYHNCTGRDDDGESEAIELLESDSDDNQESDSLFSISIESRKQVSLSEIDEKEVNSPIPIRGSPDHYKLKSIGLNQNEGRKDLESVLNPVENLTQWRAKKSAKPPTPLKDQEKENINVEKVLTVPFGEEPHSKFSNRDSKQRFNHSKYDLDDIAVDTSLSSWLVESETTSISKNSPNNSVGNSPRRVNSSRSYEGRAILGALKS
ncbi:hypothetical protein Vadar_009077 [Vaccinium darrowii]|uniref:Uncharacterized protein n=1 Tax=Vaccinium darrowii TaxID=229202 RepID=A0ACB7XGF8_9ERIC|nr:hypothetical protein Vadar_009077 [Vaccinium darrowii]